MGVAINLKLLKLKDVVAVFKLKPQFNRTETSFTPHLKLKDVVAVFKTETAVTPQLKLATFDPVENLYDIKTS